ncbi:MAG: restriction endonuclease subunit S, partial [Gammaproteobacteria bacterium]|nr:restriction endonuclease subunit S [Gammaproteobacteria bacterium]
SILKRAFSGQLIHQDPTDEPAIVLVERIRAKRAKAQK